MWCPFCSLAASRSAACNMGFMCLYSTTQWQGVRGDCVFKRMCIASSSFVCQGNCQCVPLARLLLNLLGGLTTVHEKWIGTTHGTGGADKTLGAVPVVRMAKAISNQTRVVHLSGDILHWRRRSFCFRWTSADWCCKLTRPFVQYDMVVWT